MITLFIRGISISLFMIINRLPIFLTTIKNKNCFPWRPCRKNQEQLFDCQKKQDFYLYVLTGDLQSDSKVVKILCLNDEVKTVATKAECFNAKVKNHEYFGLILTGREVPPIKCVPISRQTLSCYTKALLLWPLRTSSVEGKIIQ